MYYIYATAHLLAIHQGELKDPPRSIIDFDKNKKTSAPRELERRRHVQGASPGTWSHRGHFI